MRSLLSVSALLAVGHGVTLKTRAVAKGPESSPVSKVVTLLKDMLKQLEKEAEEDEELYDALVCWCETNDKEKTKAIADAEARIDDLTTQIEELTATSARLNTEIENLDHEVKKNQEALNDATKMREQQLKEFNAEEADMLQSIASLGEALEVLSKVGGGASLLEVSRPQLVNIADVMQKQLLTNAEMFEGILLPSQRRQVNDFLQTVNGKARPGAGSSYEPKSGAIVGILSQMKETFENNLSASQKEEMNNQRAYEQLKAAKEKEISAGQAQIDTKTQELATADEKLAQAKEDIEDTKATLSADEEYLMMLKEKCSITDSEWEERQKTRQLEMEACSKALAVLSSDDAHDLFKNTFNPDFLQRSMVSEPEKREKAATVLVDASQKWHNPRLSALANQVKLDAFTKVKKAIDDMIAQLNKEKEDEIKHKDFCTDELNQNQLQTEKKEREKIDLQAKIEDLELTIKTLTEQIETLKSEIAEMQVQMKRNGEDREKSNKEFQQTVADQRASVVLLNKALEILKGFYDKEGAAFLQKKQEPAGPPPPPGFKEYKKNPQSSGVMAMITQIIEDAKAMEAEAIKAEESGQEAYEAFIKETNASIEAKSKDIANKSEAKGKAEDYLAQANAELDATNVELDELSAYNAELHASCDFILKNFDIRQTARDEEIEALKQAKAILSGADLESFLQA
jgi:septal ring factor EnvC (AmiA/AmiB activator)